MKHQRISLESLEPLSSGEFPSYSVQMDALDDEGSVYVKKQEDRVDAAICIEAMSNQLLSSNPEKLGSVGAMFANLAFEWYAEKANIEMPQPALDLKAFDSVPERALEDGAKNMSAVKEQVIGEVGEDLTKIVYALACKRELFISAIDKLYSRATAVEEKLKNFQSLTMTPTPSVTQFIPKESHRAIMYGSSGLVAKGATIVSDLNHALTEHTHLFKRLVEKQVAWINDHKDNLLKTKDGFSQYSFNPKEYQAFVAYSLITKDEDDNNICVTSSNVLPGDVRLICETSTQTLFGYDGTSALSASKTYLAHASKEPVSLEVLSPLPVLSIEEINARLTDLRHGLKALKHWCDMGYCKMWNAAFHNQVLVKNLLSSKADSINSRGVTAISQVVVGLLHQASKDMGQYGCLTLGGMLDYIEDSTSSYITEGL